jgi:UDP-3-O-[3-hydroxymyristoyl] glucosamine N-acyltransferase
MNKMKTYTVQEINDRIQGKLVGDGALLISGPEELLRAQQQHISIIGNRKYVKQWAESKAGAAVVSEGIAVEPGEGRALIVVKNADLAMAQILELFDPGSPSLKMDIHPTAVIEEGVEIGKGCKIGAHVYVGKNVKLGDGVLLYPNVSIFDETIIGDATVIWSGTVIRERTVIGRACIFHNNVSIGADGFGFAPQDNKAFEKVPQIGNVVVEEGVEIGANTTIDRATIGSTTIRKNVKLDNQIQIAHNVEIGENTVIAAKVGVSGSTKIGKNCMIAGQVGFAGHLKIGNHVIIGAQAGITNDVDRRFKEHQSGYNPKAYTFRRRPLELVFYLDFPDPVQAIDFK